MKKKGLTLLCIASILMSLDVFTRTFFPINVDLADFLKGFGIALMIAAIFQMRAGRRTTGR